MKRLICLVLILTLTTLSMGMGIYDMSLSEVNVTAYGATADDTTDDTASIQAAIDTGAAKVIIPNGTYMINAVVSILPKSNQTIQMEDGTILKAIPNSAQGYAIVKLLNVTNVTVTGGSLLGERYDHTGTTGEWGFGLLITGKTDEITISNLTSKDCWGDGIYIGSSTIPAQNIHIENVICDNNRRQGMSITYAVNVSIINCTFKNTNGTNPQAGIDIEPNANCYVENITIKNSSFLDNLWAGISLIGNSGLYIKSVKIIDCQFENNFVELFTGGNVIDSGYTESTDSSTSSSIVPTPLQTPSIIYQTHIQNIGWIGYTSNGTLSGTIGQSKRMEAIHIKLENLAGSIEYRSHVQDIGWMAWIADGSSSGTTGQSKRMEAIQIRLTGTAADTYDIYYRVYVQNLGWMDWTSNGQSAGTAALSYRMEGIQIILVSKGGTAPGAVIRPFIQA